MKKIVAILTVIACLLSAMAVAESGSTTYLKNALSSFGLAQDFQQRLKTLAGRDAYSEIDVELCFQYAEIQIKLINVTLIELDAFAHNELQSTSYFDEVLEMISQVRSLHEMGILTADAVVKTLSDSVDTCVQGVEEIFAQLNLY